MKKGCCYSFLHIGEPPWRWDMDQLGSFVGGEFRAVGKTMKVANPFDGSTVGLVTSADAAEVDRAIATAVGAQPQMASLCREQRSAILERAAQGVFAQSENLARTIQRESGKPIQYARVEVARAVDTFRASAQAARELSGEEIPIDAMQPGKGRLAFTRRFPVGPIGSITPFNFPLNLVAHKVGPAIAAGCANVLKPASATPMSALALARIVSEAGLPAGGLNVVACDRNVGQQIVEDERLKLLTFTGSAEVGWRMKAQAGKKRVVLELGGNAAVIVMPDSDLDVVAKRCAIGAYYQAGQSCISVQRVLIHRDIHARAREAIIEQAKITPFGDPSLDSTVSGPLIDRENAERVLQWVDEAMREGAERPVGGRREGAVLEPIVLERCPRSSRVVREEVFGPVMVLDRVDSLAEAISVATDTRFGLQCGVFTNDVGSLMQAWEKLEVGAIIHNDIPAYRVDSMPYGGVRDSGLGREGPRYTTEEMTELRLLVLNK